MWVDLSHYCLQCSPLFLHFLPLAIVSSLSPFHCHSVLAYGSTITLKNHRGGGGLLHSHAHLYPEDVSKFKQQQVHTCTVGSLFQGHPLIKDTGASIFSEFSTKFKNGPKNFCSNGVKFRGFHSTCKLYWVHLSLPVYFMLASFVNLYTDFINRSLLTLTKMTTTSGS